MTNAGDGDTIDVGPGTYAETVDCSGKVLSIEEKPIVPKSNFAQTGFYIFDSRVTELVKTLKPSKRGELEIVDLVNIYFKKGELEAERVEGEWIDAGTFESLFRASTIAREHQLGMKLPAMAVEVEIKKIKKAVIIKN